VTTDKTTNIIRLKKITMNLTAYCCAAALGFLAAPVAASAVGTEHNDFKLCAVDTQANTLTICGGYPMMFNWQSTTVVNATVNQMYVTETGFPALSLIHVGDQATVWYWPSSMQTGNLPSRVDDHVAHTIPFVQSAGKVCSTSTQANTISLCSSGSVFTARLGTAFHAIVNKRRVTQIGLKALALIHEGDQITVSYTPLTGTPFNPLKQINDLTAHGTKTKKPTKPKRKH
jgi:hypothetical protein